MDATHWIDQLRVSPVFAAYQAQLAADFEKKVEALLGEPRDTNPVVIASIVGELRGLREAMRTPERIANLARENNS